MNAIEVCCCIARPVRYGTAVSLAQCESHYVMHSYDCLIACMNAGEVGGARGRVRVATWHRPSCQEGPGDCCNPSEQSCPQAFIYLFAEFSILTESTPHRPCKFLVRNLSVRADQYHHDHTHMIPPPLACNSWPEPGSVHLSDWQRKNTSSNSRHVHGAGDSRGGETFNARSRLRGARKAVPALQRGHARLCGAEPRAHELFHHRRHAAGTLQVPAHPRGDATHEASMKCYTLGRSRCKHAKHEGGTVSIGHGSISSMTATGMASWLFAVLGEGFLSRVPPHEALLLKVAGYPRPFNHANP